MTSENMTVAFWLHILFKFYFYCFAGWCIESTIVSINKHKFVNRGFLRLPLLPIYGSGAMIILSCTYTFRDDTPVIIYIVGALSATLLEYITAVIMEDMFKTKYWDYSDEKLNFQGRICMQSTLFWGFLTLVMIYWIDPLVERLTSYFSQTAVIITDSVISVLFISDTIYSFKSAFSLSKFLEATDKLRNQASEIRDRIGELQEEGKEEISEQITSLRVSLDEVSEKIRFNYKNLDLWSRLMIKDNPNLRSKKFDETLTALKERIKNKKAK